ncbi:hypothetical protein C1A50_4812 [Paenibacillus polymyxa]|nr:hypothetical protein C1A50_4812 [Paenibacillus polymyxa]
MQKENYAEVPYLLLLLWSEAKFQLSQGEQATGDGSFFRSLLSSDFPLYKTRKG